MVLISVPTLGLLLLQNKQVQTSISEWATEKIADHLKAEITLTSVHYSFFKRLQVHDLLVYDQRGDTLLFSEVSNVRIKRFRPDKKKISIRRINFDNALVQIKVDENRVSSIQFLVDSLRRDVPPEEKVLLKLERIHFSNSRFKMINPHTEYKGHGIDFSQLDLRNIDGWVYDFNTFRDTTSMRISNLSAIESSGFRLQEVDLEAMISKKFMTFSNGHLRTSRSDADIPKVDFRFSNSKNFRYLYDSIDLNIVSQNSFLDFNDLEFFFAQVKDLTGMVRLNGNVYGRLGDLISKNLEIDFREDTQLEFDMRLTGLPSSDSLLMDFVFHEFTTTPEDLKRISSNYDIGFLSDSSKYSGLSNLEYQGSFYGYQTDFETEGTLGSNLGAITLDLNMRPDSARHLKFQGSVKSKGFNLGKIMDREDQLGNLAFNLQVEGEQREGAIDAMLSGNIDTLGLYGYEYSNIIVEGIANNRKFDGSFSIRDPNIDLTFNGKIDLAGDIPTYNFRADVANLRPYYLNLREDDPEYFASFLLTTNLSGKSISDLNGNMQLVNSLFRRSGSQVQIYDMELITGNSEDSSFIKVDSELLDLELHGDYNIAMLPSNLAAMVNRHFLLFPNVNESRDTTDYFNYEVHLKDINPLLEFFLPRFTLSRNVYLNGEYSATHNGLNFSSKIKLPQFGYSGITWNNLEIDALADTSQLALRITGDSIALSEGFILESPEINSIIANNTNEYRFKWDNGLTPNYSGELISSVSIIPASETTPVFILSMDSSHFVYNDNFFEVAPSRILLSADSISVDKLKISGNDQSLVADGSYYNSLRDSLTLSLTNFNLEMLENLNIKFPLDVQGKMSGVAVLKKLEDKPLITSNLIAQGLVINNQYIGEMIFDVNWLKSTRQLALGVFSTSDRYNRISANGYYSPHSNQIDFDIELHQFGLKTFYPYLEELIEDISGYGNAEIAVDGTLSRPVTNGYIWLNEAKLKLADTKCVYSSSDTLRVYQNDIYFDEFNLNDEFGQSLTATGNISTSNFSRIFVNLDLYAQNFNFLSTTRFDNQQFYGNIFATANAEIRGPIDQLKVRAFASTERKTNLKLPLYNAAEIQSTKFITFINPKDKDFIPYQAEEPDNGKVELDMDLRVNSNSTVQLIFDPKVGDIIEASGNGNLKLEIDEKGEFSMLGDVLIADGEYLFTLQNVINKRFRVKPGGTISWNGSPTSALIDIEAIYETKASPYSLAPEPREELKKRIPVHCLLSLQGDLSNPTISPSIELPTAEPETRSIVETSIGTDEDLMRQFISLLVINNFISNVEFQNNPIAGGSSGVANVTASELLSNQLSNWLSQISTDFDIGVNYRPGDAISSDEVEVALSTQILNDRIIFSGNLDVLGDQVTTSTGEASNIVGDFDLEFRVSDKISLKAFNRVNDDRIIRQSLYTQGVGILYRNEFDTISDLLDRNKSTRDGEKPDQIQKDALREENGAFTEE